VNLFKT